MDNRIDNDPVVVSDSPVLDGACPLDRAKGISTLVSAEALASERLGRLTDKVAAALLQANLFSIRLLREEGGLGGSGVDLFEATEEIARADGSAGWCMLISNGVSTFVHSGADPRARCEIFGNGPVACWATLLPKAKSVETEGGFRVSGDFAWGSSSSFSRWVFVAEPIADSAGQQ
jgi:indole-3-acetate monooxygenase